MSASAVFLDRDGTIIEDMSYVDDPAKVRLLPRSAEAIRAFSEAGHLVVVISNQSGIARGLLDEQTLARVHERLEELLRARGARLDGAYYCPYLDGPEAKVEAYRRDSELRKPKPGMLRQAAEELGIDLSRSWMIGNAVRDVEAGRAAGCKTLLLSEDGDVAEEMQGNTRVVASLWEAVAIVSPPSSRASVPSTITHSHDAYDAPAAPTGRASLDTVVQRLDAISEQIARVQRGNRQNDFSVLRLFAALLQMFAIVSGVWGALALLNDLDTAATGRLLLACFFQLASLTAFAIDRFR